jgi:hypothetical protein
MARYKFIGVMTDPNARFGRIRISEVSVSIGSPASVPGVIYSVVGVDWWKRAAVDAVVESRGLAESFGRRCDCNLVIDDIVDYPADSTDDSVACAAFAAAWLALGGSERELQRRYVDGEWRMSVEAIDS